MKCHSTIISILWSLFYPLSLIAQSTPQPFYTLDSDLSGNESQQFVARDHISLQPGFTFTPESSSSFTAQVNPCLLFPPTENTYLESGGGGIDDPQMGSVVGAIPGQLAVAPSGALLYAIPIEMPSGIRNIQPHISLSYNSMSGNGIAGWGWNIEGISTITRTGSTLYHDNKIASVNLSNEDNLSLNGQRLLLVSGPHLVHGAEYRTEVESFQKISYIALGGRLLCFEVKNKDGLTYQYGLNNNYEIKLPGTSTTYTWLLKRISDRNQNNIDYTYGKNDSTGEFWIEKISYAAGGYASPSNEVVNEIEFIYTDTRPDIETYYIVGKKITQQKRLQSIVCRTNGQLFRKYSLDYTFDGLYSKLKSVKLENSSDEKVCSTIIDQDVWEDSSKSEIELWGTFSSDLDARPIFGDFNGDSRRDFITCKEKRIQLYINTEIHGDIKFIKKQEFLTYGDNLKDIAIADLNGDGLMDLIAITHAPNGTYRYNYYFSNGEQFSNGGGNGYQGFNTSPTDRDFIIGDFNGDGKHEVMLKSTQQVIEGNGVVTASGGILNWGEELVSSFPNNLTLLDITGNGKTNICTRDLNNGYVYELTGNRFTLLFSTSDIRNDSDLYPGDFNKDGKTDFLVFQYNYELVKTEAYILYSTGTSFEKKMLPDMTNASTVKGFVGDFNLDGKTDCMFAEANNGYFRFRVGINNGSDFTFSTYNSNYPIPYEYEPFKYLDVADYDGDGRSEVGYNRYTDLWFIRSFQDTFFSTIQALTDGLSNNYSFSFKSLAQSGIYQSTTDDRVFYPVVRTPVPLHVLSHYSHNSNSYDYFYKDIRIHKQGKGFLGFGQININDFQNKISTTTEYEYNTSYFYVYPLRQTVATHDGQYISTTDMNNRYLYMGHNRVFPYLYSKTTMDYLSTLSTTITYSNYDASGNLQTITTQTGDLIETQNIVYTEAGAWCASKPLSTTVTLTQGDESITRTKQYKYQEHGHPALEIHDPDDPNRKEIVYASYDPYGYSRKMHVTANGLTQTSSTSYSKSARFLTSSTDALGQTTHYQWDETRGVLVSETNPKGQITQYEYDGWGNRTKTIHPNGIEEVIAVQWATNSSIGATYYTYRQISGSPPERIYYNRLGQELMRETEGLNQTPIRIFTEYYPNGRVKRESRPTFSASPEAWAKEYVYDAFGRISTVTTPIGKTTYAYDGSTTTITSSEGITSTTLNSAGQKASVSTQGKSVTFEYYPDGSIKRSTPEGGQSIAFEYDLQGNRTKIIDPDAGTVRSAYDGWGNLLWERQKIHADKDSVSTVYSYDPYNRLVLRNRNGESTTYTYDEHNRISRILLSGKHEQLMTYDSFDRPTRMEERIADRSFVRDMEYDSFGRLQKSRYPSGYTVTHFYDRNGFAIESKDDQYHSIWKAVSMDAEGKLLQLKKGEKTTTYGYDRFGLVNRMETPEVVDYWYSWNQHVGGIIDRYDAKLERGETLYYDSFNRFMNGELYDHMEISYYTKTLYDEKGRISELDHWGENATFVYGEGTGKPHALSSIRNIPDRMNAERLLRNISYNDAQKVSTIQSRGHQYAYTYGVDDQKRIIRYTNSNDPKSNYTKYYLGDYEEIVDADGNIQKYHYLSGGDGWAGLMIRSGEVDRYYHVYTDYLGSPIAVADENHQVVERYAFNAWGMRRDLADWRKEDPRTSFITTRGFTGHEHLDAVGLIDMGGRVFDPLTAQFLSADPYIQAPENWLNYNRYGYCLGNPFRYTDPNGELWWLIPGLIGGSLNLIGNWGNIDNFWEGLACFGVGFGGGILAGLTGGASIGMQLLSAGGAGLLTGMTNSIVGQTNNQIGLDGVNWGSTFADAGIGAASSLAGFGVGRATGTIFKDISIKIGGWELGAKSALAQGLKQGVGGFAGGYTAGAVGIYLKTGDMSMALEGAWSSGAIGFGLSFASGFGGQYAANRAERLNGWTGEATGNYSVYEGYDPTTGDPKYVGITGREPNLRFNEHTNSSANRSGLRYEVVKTGLDRTNARIYEQKLIIRYQLPNLYNKINSISPKYWNQYNIKSKP